MKGRSDLQAVLSRLIKDRGISILDNPKRCGAFLHDYAKGAFKREARIFLLSLEAGCHRALLKTTDRVKTSQRLIQKLQDDYGITAYYAQEAVSLLEKVIADRELTPEEKKAALEKAALTGGYRAEYELGLFFKRSGRFEEASRWLEAGAKHCIDLYEARVMADQPKPVPEGLVKIPAGTFIMGSPEREWGRKDNEAEHEVQVGAFYLGRTPVTQKEYEAAAGVNPSAFKAQDNPVERVSWFDAVQYCNALSVNEGRKPAYRVEGEFVIWDRNAPGYRLPTEAEWEYACRGGSAAPFSAGAVFSTDQGNYNGNYPYNSGAKGVYRGAPTRVGSFPPNPLGLYDMHGNVWEWCWDWYGPYSREKQRDPAGAPSGSDRVCRGGSWSSLGNTLRSANRGLNIPSYRNPDLGFRVLLPLPPAQP
ncbi:MAG: formylglycine-generating enzyme family protein [Spirochaetaceae bacterium]|jgi:formylglycine-generating enzyme required for sulfatase activity|nr:formylglycine-generating enzyme family protein [Spirochaetaceae bacterium]